MSRQKLCLLNTALLLLSPGCRDPEPPTVTLGESTTISANSAPSMPDGKDLFSKRCASCHGATGRGDGPAAQFLTPKPPSFADAAWQAGNTNEALSKIIVEGGPSVGKSPSMPAQQDLKTQPTALTSLITHLRSFNPSQVD